jgi:hypothetical protein
MFVGCVGSFGCLIAGAQQPPDPLPFPSPATPRLAADLKVSVVGQSLRELVVSLQKSTRLPIVLDRRVDPSVAAIPPPIAANAPGRNGANELQQETSPSPMTLGPTLADVLDAIADRRGLQWASAGDLVLIAPAGKAIPAATEMLAARIRLRTAAAGFPPKPISWPQLTTPTEALQVVADTWQLDKTNVQLPHDLWPAIDLGTVDVTSALGVISSQFDLHFELDPETRQLTSRALEDNFVAERDYPLVDLIPAQRKLVTDRPNVRLIKQRTGWQLTGDAAAHWQLELAIFKRGRKPNPGGAAARSVTKYTFKFNGTLSDALSNLCQAGNLQLDMATLDAGTLSRRIELEAKDQSIEELLAEVARLGEITVEVQAAQVTAKPK